MKSPVQLTEKLLITAAGWEVIRHARAMREAGRVAGAQWTPPLLQGSVREGEREYRAGLRILSQTNIDNLCTCRPSREYGTICAHSVAVGLAVLAGMQPAPVLAAPPTGLRPGPEKASPQIILPTRPDPGATARLHVVLAPDLSAAWNKGQVVVVLEVEADGRRQPLGAPTRVAGATALLPADHKIVEKLAAILRAPPGGMAILDRVQLLDLLETMAGFARVTLGKSSRLSVDAAPLRPPLHARTAADGALELTVAWPVASRPLAAGGRAWLLRTGANAPSIQPISPGLSGAYAALFDQKPLRLPAEQAAAFLTLEWAKLAPFFDLHAEVGGLPANAIARDRPLPAEGSDPGVEPGQPVFALSIEGSLNQLGARLQAFYPNKRIVTVGITPEKEAFTYPPPAGSRARLHTRNVPAERQALDRLVDWDFRGPDATGHYFLRGENDILRFFALGLPALQKEPGWEVSIGARFQNVSRNLEIITPEVAVRGSGEDWFEMELSMTGSSGERFPAAEIQRLLQMGRGHTRLSNGKLAILPGDALKDLQEVLRDCDPSQPRPGVYRLGRSQGAYLDATLEKWGVGTGPSWEQWRGRQGGFRPTADVPLPPGLGETMRPYQRDGVRWLHLLAGNGLGGILADEMGLGKTLQALAYLASTRAAAGKDAPPSLVVCPTSLVDNWRREAARFTPDLRTLAIDGPDRAPLFRPDRRRRPRHHLLRAPAPRLGPLPGAGVRHRHPGRSAPHQEPGQPGGAGRLRAPQPPPLRADGHPDGKQRARPLVDHAFRAARLSGIAAGFPRTLRAAAGPPRRPGGRRGARAPDPPPATRAAAPAQEGCRGRPARPHRTDRVSATSPPPRRRCTPNCSNKAGSSSTPPAATGTPARAGCSC